MKETPRDQSSERIRVAVVGTGLAGLTTAYLLQNDERRRFSVTLFEQAKGLSFDAASVAVTDDHTGTTERIDLPMRASAGGYYANLIRMYEHLGVPIHPIRFLFVFAKALASQAGQSARAPSPSAPESAPGTYFVHASNLHRTPPPWPSTRGVVTHVLEILYLIICQFWFSVACFTVPPRAAPRDESVAEYLDRLWLPRRYVSHYLLPLMSCVATCSHAEILAFPASDLINYKRMSHGQQHYAVCGGVNQVQLRLAEGMSDVRLGARVLEVRPVSAQTEQLAVRWASSSNGDTSEEIFDRVVMAVSPDVAGKIFKPLAHTLGKIPTLQVESSVHSPEDGAGPAGRFHVAGDQERLATCMHHGRDASRAQVITFRTSFSGQDSKTESLQIMPSGATVWTSPLQAVDEKTMLHRARFTRTLRTIESRALVERIMGRSSPRSKKLDGETGGWVNGERNVWLAGAWCWDGMVLLEGCIVSAMAIADDFGVQVPWRPA